MVRKTVQRIIRSTRVRVGMVHIEAVGGVVV